MVKELQHGAAVGVWDIVLALKHNISQTLFIPVSSTRWTRSGTPKSLWPALLKKAGARRWFHTSMRIWAHMPSTHIKTKGACTCLQSQHWGSRDRRTPWGCCSASLDEIRELHLQWGTVSGHEVESNRGRHSVQTSGSTCMSSCSLTHMNMYAQTTEKEQMNATKKEF